MKRRTTRYVSRFEFAVAWVNFWSADYFVLNSPSVQSVCETENTRSDRPFIYCSQSLSLRTVFSTFHSQTLWSALIQSFCMSSLCLSLYICIERAHESATDFKVHCVYECHRRQYIINESHFSPRHASVSHASSKTANENPFHENKTRASKYDFHPELQFTLF